MLSNGRYDEQHASILALREYGYEAWGHGYGKEFHFTVRAPGAKESTVIEPLYPDDRGYRAEDGSWVDL